MPSNIIKGLAAQAKVSIDAVEKKWNQAKSIVKSEYSVDEKDASFWPLTTGITKKMLGLNKTVTFKEFIERDPHGHVVPRADGMTMRCGGVPTCPSCQDELLDKLKIKVGR